MVVVTHNRDIERHRAHRLIILLDEAVAAGLLIELNPDIASELDLAGILRSPELKRIAVLEPVVGDLHLIAVLDLLLEHTEAVADTAAVSRIAESGQGIQETGRQSSEAAVSERRISLLILDSVKVDTKILKRSLDLLVCGHIDQRVAEGAAHQKLHGHVVEDLRIFLLHLLGGSHPVIDNNVLHRIGDSLKQLLLVCLLELLPEQPAHIVLYRLLKCLLVKL